MCESGHGVPQDHAEAVYWYRLAAEQGNAVAQYNLGAALEAGLGVPQNYIEAIGWYRKAARQNNAAAQFNLGTMYYCHRGVPRITSGRRSGTAELRIRATPMRSTISLLCMRRVKA
jgi:TPR repeat protein